MLQGGKRGSSPFDCSQLLQPLVPASPLWPFGILPRLCTCCSLCLQRSSHFSTWQSIIHPSSEPCIPATSLCSLPCPSKAVLVHPTSVLFVWVQKNKIQMTGTKGRFRLALPGIDESIRHHGKKMSEDGGGRECGMACAWRPWRSACGRRAQKMAPGSAEGAWFSTHSSQGGGCHRKWCSPPPRGALSRHCVAACRVTLGAGQRVVESPVG